MIKSTKDYSIFKKCMHNRELVKGNLEKIKKSIQTKNLLEFRPILVNSKMEVIDGQHRLKAAEELGIPVYYEIKNDIEKSDIILLNDNSKSWSREDYLNYYCKEGLTDYIKLKNFMEINNLPFSSALVVLGKPNTTRKKDGFTHSDLFKKGLYKFPEKAEEESSKNILRLYREIVDFVFPKLEGNRRYLFGSNFMRALYMFFSIKSVDFEVFKEKLSYKIDLVRPCSKIKDYLNILKMIYNWRNRNPITIDPFLSNNFQD